MAGPEALVAGTWGPDSWGGGVHCRGSRMRKFAGSVGCQACGACVAVAVAGGGAAAAGETIVAAAVVDVGAPTAPVHCTALLVLLVLRALNSR